MLKIYLVARSSDRGRLLDALRDLGAVHLTPMDPAKAVAEEKTLTAINRTIRARQILSSVEPAGETPEVQAAEVAEEALRISRESSELRSRLALLHRQIEQMAIWGDVRLEQFRQLHDAGIMLRFFLISSEQLSELQAEMVYVITPFPGKRSLVAVVDRDGSVSPPTDASEIAIPQQDRPSNRAEAAKIDAKLKQNAERLTHLANLTDKLNTELAQLRRAAQYTAAERSGLAGKHLFAIQGWVPSNCAERLSEGLREAGIDAGVQTFEPAEGETPPTLISYPRWARPIKGLFEMLGTFPGYSEFDLSGFFMIALPIFAAMLIGDAGYGLLFVLLPLLFYRKAVVKMGEAKVHLIMVLGATTMIWGLLTGNIFGVTPNNLIQAGGFWTGIGNALGAIQVIRGGLLQQATTIMKLSFIIAAIHLSVAQLRGALQFAPNIRAFSKIGWALFLWGIFGLIWYVFFDSQQSPPRALHSSVPWLLGIGTLLAIGFAYPSRNIAKALGLGLASFPLAALSGFSDSVSYIRLMGVGLTSTIIAQTFNGLAVQAAGTTNWFAGSLVALFGHGLNIAMCMIAILAHGVRLNMLEFSNNAGVQWAGYPYQPFAGTEIKEH